MNEHYKDFRDLNNGNLFITDDSDIAVWCKIPPPCEPDAAKYNAILVNPDYSYSSLEPPEEAIEDLEITSPVVFKNFSENTKCIHISLEYIEE